MGKKALVKEDIFGAVASSLVIIRPNCEQVIADYLMFALDSPGIHEQLTRANNGSSQPNLSAASVRGYEIDLPDKETQKRIVTLLSILSLIIDAYNKELEWLDDLIKARFVEMFGDPETGKCIFQTDRLGNLAKRISDGVHAKPVYTETGKPFLSVVNINKGTVDFTDCKYVSEEAYQKMIKSTHPQKGDILYTKVGATYGIPAYVDTDKDFCLYVSVCLIKPIHERINARFLALQMAMPSIKHQADARIKGIGVPDLHLNQISEFSIICPPRELQDTFVDFVEHVDKSKVVVQKALDEAKLLFESLMQKYFG